MNEIGGESGEVAGVDEMVDGAGRLRPHWRTVLNGIALLGDGGLAERARRLDRAFEDEGVAAMLPGGVADGRVWRCDPVPLPLAAAEFAALEAGLAQRARLFSLLLADLYGPQRLLAEGVLPPPVVYANPAFLRSCHQPDGGPAPVLHLYAADMVRGENGAWHVLSDRTAGASGIGLVHENRQIIARVMPELMRGAEIRPLRPFFDFWQDSLARLAPPGRANPGVALLTPGTTDPMWFEHMFLARELGCFLVEGGDLTVRGSAVFLKTLKGLEPVDLLLRRVGGRYLDPLEQSPERLAGVAGLLAAQRAGSVRLLNHPGADMLEAPAFAALLPRLCALLLGEPLALPSLPTRWLGEPSARTEVLAAPTRWRVRPALDGRAPITVPGELSEAKRAALLARIAERPWDYCASPPFPPSVAPCLGAGGMTPKPIVLRLFLVGDGDGWRAVPGGLARVVEPEERLSGRLPRHGMAKDVWVLAEEGADLLGPPASPLAAMPIRRSVGELPSRVADNMYWLGRYVERLENTARLVRATLDRVVRGTWLPREHAELNTLVRTLAQGHVIDGEAAASVPGLSLTLLATVAPTGAIGRILAEVARLTELSRDRLTGEMYAAFTQSLRTARGETGRVDRSLDQLAHALSAIQRFATIVAGVAAENMVRGGTWLFLELGRRLERASAILADAAEVLAGPAGHVETGLRLLLELCDSAITYRSRYLALLQPAPVLDLVLADEANPRALAFQLAAIRRLLTDIGGGSETVFSEEATLLLARIAGLLAEIVAAPEQAVAAAALPAELANLGAEIASLSDRLSRRYFALLPAAQTIGLFEEQDRQRGAA